MKKLFFPFLLIGNIAYSQIKNFEDESNYLLALSQLIQQSYTEHYAETDWDEGVRQYLEFDPMSMNFVFYRTPFDEDDNGKLQTNIQWLAKSVIPLYEIDTLIGDNKKNTIIIKTKGQTNKYDIQTYKLKSGGEYHPAAQDNEIIIRSDLWHINENYTTTGGGNMQEVDERCVKNIIGSAAANGISFYVSTNSPGFSTWTLLNP